ncbi:GIY-YIG nuclease family protein [Capnocytophaga canis]|uniref:GIY-YIG nuclease family protein n=1 Tax=Capnocytophaga canis TaxID=1848903 RepID=UPI001562BD3A|nr:GIY-YIG nuclease family protein [Capnocytophaga canis]
MNEIKLNDILQIPIEDLKRTKIRLIIMVDKNWNPIEMFQDKKTESLLEGQYWNYSKNVYQEGEITIGLVRIKDDKWLLFHIGKVTKKLDIYDGVGYEYEDLKEYQKYVGRLIVEYKNTSQTLVRRAESIINDCKVSQILPDIFNEEIFPGYDKVNLSWKELSKVVEKEVWKTALENQKGVYLITDVSNNKRYVGSAYGDKMLLGRWKNYVENGHGGNKGLLNLDFDHIKENFRYSILDIFKSTIDDEVIIQREQWWKRVLLSQQEEFGYNKN